MSSSATADDEDADAASPLPPSPPAFLSHPAAPCFPLTTSTPPLRGRFALLPSPPQDDAIHVALPEGAPSPEPLAIAKVLAAVLRSRPTGTAFDLVLLGKQAIDSDASQTGQILAGLQNWSQGTFASKVELLADSVVRVTREIDGGLETVDGRLPMVITTDLRLNEPRYATLPNIMKAKKKALKTVKPEELAVDVGHRLETLELREPAKRVGGGKVGSVGEMVERMKAAGVA